MAEEPFIFLAGIICFFAPIYFRRSMMSIQMIAGVILFFCILIFHEDTQVKLIYLLAFVWVFGSISALSVSAEKSTK
ncbi:hypothetical protein ABGV42_15830 [Paenibacillus pabuli]|uniref:hypothetical protein n=1 Tax=Paenibacillus pabuli TaxID=1472 RepID=UPI003242F2DE